MSTSFADQKKSRSKLRDHMITATITLAITLTVTILSFLLGGFGSQDAMTSGSKGFSLPILAHLGTAIPALMLGPVILRKQKGTNLHRALGKIWVALMVTTVIASAFIRSPGTGIAGTGYSFIHFFTIWTLVNAPVGVWLARKGRIEAHRGVMTGLYIGLVLAGTVTLVPGRLLGNMIFSL